MMHFYWRYIRHAVTAVAILVNTLPVAANDLANALLETLPNAREGWSLQSASKETAADGVKAFGQYSSDAGNRLFVIEIDVRGQIVPMMADTWDTGMLIADAVDIGGTTYQLGTDGFTGLIDGKILVRAYTPDADEREVIKLHLEDLDDETLAALAKQLK